MTASHPPLEDGRTWNGLAYVHNKPVNGCDCGSCVGYFEPLPRFKVNECVAARAFTDCFGKHHPRLGGFRVTEVRRIQPDSIPVYYRVTAVPVVGIPNGVNQIEGAEKFFENETQ